MLATAGANEMDTTDTHHPAGNAPAHTAEASGMGKGAIEPSAGPSNMSLNASGETTGSVNTQDTVSKPKKAPRRKDHQGKGKSSHSDPNTPAPTVSNAQVSSGNADLAGRGNEQSGRSKRGHKPSKRLLGEI
ncbi:hypothetical protein FS749_011294 [Ceratobasidium sp. UAMH 11750]|nr:hypothetical protein FS749_011294 [Ceratobasidium sp. UAMH 11750]